MGWLELGKNGEVGSDGRNDDVEFCDEAWARVLRLSGTSTDLDGCSSQNVQRRMSGRMR